MRKSIVFALALVFAILTVGEAYADATCKTRNKCRWWRKKYVANTAVGCFDILNGIPLCYNHSASCGTVFSSCGPKTCFWGQAAAWASNGPDGGCQKGGVRYGFGWYGTEPTEPDPALRDARGDHEMTSRVEYDEVSQEVHLLIDSLRMTSTVDESFSRVDVWLYLEPDDESQDPEPTPENTIWYGYLLSQNGQLQQSGFDELARRFTNDGAITTLDVQDYVKTIPYLGTAEEFEFLSVKIMVDGGIPDKAPPR